MSAVPLAKPSTRTLPVIVGVSIGISDASSGDGDDPYCMKVTQAETSHYSPLTDTTGDGDDEPCWTNNGFLYGRHVLSGIMLAKRASDDPDGNGTAELGLPYIACGKTYTMEFFFADKQSFKEDIIMERINTSWSRKSAFIGVRMIIVKDGPSFDATAQSTPQAPANWRDPFDCENARF